MQILDGLAVSAHIKEQIKTEVTAIKSKGGKTPHLAAILVGNNPASEAYVGSKVRTCEELGFGSTLLRFGMEMSEEDLLAEVKKLNEDKDIDGILVQLPLPKHISENAVIKMLLGEKHHKYYKKLRLIILKAVE